MSAQHTRSIYGGLARMAMAFALVVGPIQVLRAVDPPAVPQPAEGGPTGALEDDNSAEMGIVVAATPSSGVLIVDVAPHSPAEISGLEPGDFLLSVDGKSVANPAELRKLIQAKKPGTQVEFSIWRQGKTMQRDVTLAAKSAEPDVDQDKAWLGVVLQASDEPGALVELLHPRGPAKQAGLRRGDVIVQIDGEKVSSIEEAVAQIEKHKPQATVNLVVLREGKEETIKVTLGRASEALIGLPPLALVPFGWTDGLTGEQDQTGDDYAQLKDLVRQLRKEVSELRQELRGRPGNGASEKRGDKEESTKPEGTESRNPAKPDSTGDTDAASAAGKSPPAVSRPTSDYLAQFRPYYRYAGRGYRYWYPAPRPYRYSYYYHRGAPYYYAYPQTNAYPNAGPYYYGPGVTVRVGPRVYFRYWR